MGSLLRRLSIGALVLVLIITGCTAGAPTDGQSGQASGPGIELRHRMIGDWQSLDPWTLLSSPAGQIVSATYDRLVSFEGGKIVPYLASSWTQTPTSLTFKLRNDATCADGEKVTPTVILNHFRRMFDPAKRSASVVRFFGPGPHTLAADEANSTFTLTMGVPFTEALLNFTSPTIGSIVCSAGTKNPAMLAEGTAGSGPYLIETAVHGDHVKLKLRPEWKWGPGGVTAQTGGIPSVINYRVVLNETTTANLLGTGALDMGQVLGPDIKRLEADKTLKGMVDKVISIDQMVFQQGPGSVTQDKALREALMTAIDPKAWNEAANDGKGALSTSFVTEDGDCFEPATARLAPTPSLDRAKQVLLSNGYTADSAGKILKDGKPVAIKILGHTNQADGPDYLLSQFTKLGLAVTLQTRDAGAFPPQYRAGDWNVVVHQTTSATNSYGSAALFSGPVPPNGNNFPRIVDPVLNDLVKAAQTTVGDERCNNWKAVQRRVLEQYHHRGLAGRVTYLFARQGFETASVTVALPHLLRSPLK